MARNQFLSQSSMVRVLCRIAPGLASLPAYKWDDFPHDLIAGLSVAAVALPVGVAYAQLAGFNPAVGLYSSILPLFAYAAFGTSRQLIVGPDAATCALVAAAVTPLATDNRDLYQSLSVTLAFLAGLFCIGASFLKLGALADFLSKPILVGFLNGIALSIILGQLGKIFGFSIASGGIVPRLYEFISKLGSTHWPTLAIGLGVFLVLELSSYFLKRVPAALVAMAIAGIAVKVFSLEQYGVKTVGEVPAGLPHLIFPHLPMEMLPDLMGDAAGLALVAFSSMMLTSRSFASRNRYDVDADQDFAALGVANIVSAFSQGFAVSGADSRTAVSDSNGGRTQVTGIVAAIVVGTVLLFLTEPLRYVPIAALGAVLVKAALSLVDVPGLRTIWGIDRREFAVSILATVGVLTVGSIHAILVAVILALLRFVKLTFRPRVEILGQVQGYPGFHSLERHPDAVTTRGVVLLRFNAPIVFFNAPYFKREVLASAVAAGPSLKRVLIDMLPVTMVDATGLFTIKEVADTLRERGVELAAAGRQTEWKVWAKSRQKLAVEHRIPIYPTLREGMEAFLNADRISGGSRGFAEQE
jgi:high affinity sulfate transporter 1